MDTNATLPTPTTTPPSPFPVEELITQADQLFSTGDLQGAKSALEAAAQKEPERTDIKNFLGNVLYHQEDLDAARDQFESASKLDPSDASTFTSLAAVNLAMGWMGEAEQAARSAIKIDPTHNDALRILGGLLVRARNFKEAYPVYTRLVNASPTETDLLLSWGCCCYEVQDFENAISAFERTLAQDPGNSIAQENLQQVRSHLAKNETSLRPTPAPAATPSVTPTDQGIIQEISARDEMFTGNRAHYFGVGESALNCVRSVLPLANVPESQIQDVLDLPCGHGRELRTFKAAFPNARFTACDLNRDGVDFCQATFGAEGIYSSVNPEQVQLPRQYDLIWCGSLLTHLESEPCAKFIELFRSALKPGGLMFFSMGGRWVAQNMATSRYKYCLDDTKVESILQQYNETEFGYVDYAGSPGYGITIATPNYVLKNWLSFPDLKLINYCEKGWDNHQDIICLQKQGPNELLA